jgi:hypothetical protein
MRELSKALPLNGRSPEREGPAVRIEAGKEDDFQYLRSWLASSEWLDRLIAATEARATAGIGLSRSPGLHFTGPVVLTAGRRLLEWGGDPAPVRIGRS